MTSLREICESKPLAASALKPYLSVLSEKTKGALLNETLETDPEKDPTSEGLYRFTATFLLGWSEWQECLRVMLQNPKNGDYMGQFAGDEYLLMRKHGGHHGQDELTLFDFSKSYIPPWGANDQKLSVVLLAPKQ